jgi:mRNA degradation ribonuclease J1/J2
MKGNEAITTSLSNEVETLVKQELNKKMINPQTIKQVVIDHLSQAIHKLTLRKPLIIPILVDLNQQS